MTRPHYQMRGRESLWAGVLWLSALAPLWGLLAAWVVRESWRERSRHVVIHATQAIWWQAILLAIFVVYAAVGLFASLLGRLHERAADVLAVANDTVMLFTALAYAGVCLAMAWRCLDGNSSLLPIIGRRIHDQEFDDRPATDARPGDRPIE